MGVSIRSSSVARHWLILESDLRYLRDNNPSPNGGPLIRLDERKQGADLFHTELGNETSVRGLDDY